MDQKRLNVHLKVDISTFMRRWHVTLDLAGRTMLTSEGTTNRSSHIIEVNGRKRFLTPIECERLNGFDDKWTATMPVCMRYFFMGNALVTDLIEKMGKTIKQIDAEETNDAVLVKSTHIKI
ncbi:DNA cytosine methyltransferase [Peribacillus frigoritolerans]